MSSHWPTRGEASRDALAALAESRLARYKQTAGFIPACPACRARPMASSTAAHWPAILKDSDMIKLDIISDPICPWCYIGWSNLARALEQRPDHPPRPRMAPVPAQPPRCLRAAWTAAPISS